MDDGARTASELIADFVASRRDAALSEEDLHLGRRALLDTLASAIAGRADPVAALVTRYARTMSGPQLGTIWTAGETVAIETAALANGAIGHVLDYDDVTSPMRGHPSVVILPALAALAEAEGATGRQVMAAFATGLEVVAKLGRVVAIDHVSKGWHSTSTLGAIAAAAACSQLLRLSAEETVSALGLAIAQAAGTRANFGTMAKSFQAGQAAAAALRAVSLARLGFTASPTAIDGPSGFIALCCGGESVAGELAQLGAAPLETQRSGLDVKRYPNCYATHRSIDALLALREEHRLTLDRVERVDVVTSARAQAPLVYPRPRTGLEGKFSLEYAMAAVLADGGITFDSFTDAMVLRPDIQAFLPRVHCREADGPPLPRWAEVTLRLREGSCLGRRVEILKGSAASPLSDAEIVAKLRSCCAHGDHPADPERIAGLVLAMDGEAFGPTLRTALGYA